jgi:hypothetical protein
MSDDEEYYELQQVRKVELLEGKMLKTRATLKLVELLKQERKQGVIDAFNEILKQFEEAKYLENSPRDYKLRLKWFLEKRLNTLKGAKELEK